MLSFSVHKKNKGFTLPEVLIIVVMIGILAAVAAPSFLAFLNRSRVNDALVSVEGALKEAQREAIKKSSNSCTVNLNTSSVTGSCLVTGDRSLPDGVQMVTNNGGTPLAISFSHKGTNTLSNTGTVVLYNSNNSDLKKCLVISHPLGIIRAGNYSGSTASVDSTKCTTT